MAKFLSLVLVKVSRRKYAAGRTTMQALKETSFADSVLLASQEVFKP